jgi:sec-independent protein translocase protein TatB
MFGIDSSELLIIAVVALVVIGPKDLPRVMRTIGNFVGKARGMAKHFRSGFDTMIREAELEDMEKKWKSDNERIMREHPAPLDQAPDAWPEPEYEPPAPPKPAPKAPSRPAASRPKPPPARGAPAPRRAPPPAPKSEA